MSSEGSNLLVVGVLAIDGRAGDGDGWSGRLARTRAAVRRARRVGATILAVCNAKIGVFGLVLDAVDGFNCVREVRKVDEGTVPEAYRQKRVTLKVAFHKLFFQVVDELNVTILAKVTLQTLFVEQFEVFNTTDVNIPSRA